ncbi:MAG: methyltransferase domain-containing protein [Planctomycetota bacterium]
MRGCDAPLAATASGFACERGHAFDLARSGHLNLLQPQDKRSASPGDAKASIEGRAALHEAGVLAHVTEAIVAAVESGASPSRGAVLDIGCGSGHVARALEQAGDVVALDLSTHAAQRAARTAPRARVVVANADRRIPLATRSCRAAVCVYGPKPAAELGRVLAPDGVLVLAVPSPDDLVELRSAITGEELREDRTASALAAFGQHFELAERARVEARRELDAERIAATLASSYRGARHRESERAAELTHLAVTFGADVLVLRPRR